MKRKGQAAIEFMTTYGWALMAVMLAIGALSYFDFLDADRYTKTVCNTGGQIQCLESTMDINGELKLSLRNNYPVDIIVLDFGARTQDGIWISDGISTPIARGDSENVSVTNLPGFAKGKKIAMDLNISFKRDTAGANTYVIRGTTTVKVTS